MSAYASTSAHYPPPPQASTGDISDLPTAGLGHVEVPLGPTNQPRLLVRNLNKDEAVFHLSGVEGGLANALRRTVIADVPTVGKFKFIHLGLKMNGGI